MRSDLSGEPLTASVRDILDEHEETARRADEERRAEEAERERASRRKADEERAALRHTGGERRLRPRRDAREAARPEGSEDEAAAMAAGVDPRLLALGVFAGLVLAGGLRRIVLLGVLGAGAWALYRRVLEPARDPAAVLQ
jgi:hypothetical protein